MPHLGLRDLAGASSSGQSSSTVWPSKATLAKPRRAGMQALRGTWCHGAQYNSPRAGKAANYAAPNELCIGEEVGRLHLEPYKVNSVTSTPSTKRSRAPTTVRSEVSDARESHRSSSRSSARSMSRSSTARRTARAAPSVEGGPKKPTRIRHVKVTSKEIGQASWNQRLKANEVPNYTYPPRPLPSDGVPGYTFGDVKPPGKFHTTKIQSYCKCGAALPPNLP